MTKERERKLFDGFLQSCATELKILLIALFILCSAATLFQFLPFRFPTSDLRLCLSRISAATIPESPSPLPLPPPSQVQKDQILQNGSVRRAFNPYGSAAYNFVTMGAYRAGADTFAIVGLSSKPLHVFGKPSYYCEWVPDDPEKNVSLSVSAEKILPDWGYGRVYTVVVVNCTFSNAVNADNSGGKLVLYASASGAGDKNFNFADKIECLIEEPRSQNFSVFLQKPKYDYMYCGSPLYGNLSPQRVREWIAYHVRFFGERSHFVIHDAGGVHEEVYKVLKPWMELGYVTLQDIRDQERFDGYYHNQFLVVNDCLFRYKFLAKWMFFFDVDEFIYVPPKSTIKSVLDAFSGYTQFTIEQMPMSNKLCLYKDRGKSYRKWGFEKLVYRDVKRGIRRDRKYAVQPRNLFSAGVHLSQNFVGKSTHSTWGRIKYFHYHGTIAERREPCRMLVNKTETTLDQIPYVKDTTMRDIAGSVKSFELRMIGPRLQKTRQ